MNDECIVTIQKMFIFVTYNSRCIVLHIDVFYLSEVMKVVVNKTHSGRIKIYCLKTPTGDVVYKKQIAPMVKRKTASATMLEGSQTLFNIAGPKGRVRMRSIRHDSYAMREDWSRVGQSVLDGMIVAKL